ncbi:MAG: gamma-glutamylcyclotransferase family protein [Methyloceanibacter sp.]
MSVPRYLFVYGTLRSESAHPMAHRLRTGAKFVGKANAPGLLYDLGAYPAAVFSTGAKRHVIGDVFELAPGDKLLAELDAYEGTDSLYARTSLEVTLEDGRTIEAWTYGVREAPNTKLILGGDFIVHWNQRNPRPVPS